MGETALADTGTNAVHCKAVQHGDGLYVVEFVPLVRGEFLVNVTARSGAFGGRKLGNLPGSVPPQEVVDFFNDAMIKAGLNKWAGPPIVQAVHQSQDGGFVFIELRDVDETTALLMYDGVIFKDRQLKVRRPADYNPPPSAGPDPPPTRGAVLRSFATYGLAVAAGLRPSATPLRCSRNSARAPAPGPR